MTNLNTRHESHACIINALVEETGCNIIYRKRRALNIPLISGTRFESCPFNVEYTEADGIIPPSVDDNSGPTTTFKQAVDALKEEYGGDDAEFYNNTLYLTNEWTIGPSAITNTLHAGYILHASVIIPST